MVFVKTIKHFKINLLSRSYFLLLLYICLQETYILLHLLSIELENSNEYLLIQNVDLLIQLIYYFLINNNKLHFLYFFNSLLLLFKSLRIIFHNF